MIRKIFIKLFFILLLISESSAIIEVDITRGNLNPLPVAVSPLFSDENTDQNLKSNYEIIKLGKKYQKLLRIISKQLVFLIQLQRKLFFKSQTLHI